MTWLEVSFTSATSHPVELSITVKPTQRSERSSLACSPELGVSVAAPAGRTGEKQDMVQLTTAAFLANGSKPTYECGPTDSTMPMSLGIERLAEQLSRM